jgi:hypothetical protein
MHGLLFPEPDIFGLLRALAQVIFRHGYVRIANLTAGLVSWI